MTNDDPKLTAYALNELEEADRAEVEAYLADNPAARAVVEEIRRTVAVLTAGMRVTNVPALTTLQRETITSSPTVVAASLSYESVRRPALRVWAKWALATAACAALAAGGYLVLAGRQTAPRRVAQNVPMSRTLAATQPHIVSSNELTLKYVPSSHLSPSSGLDGIRFFANNSTDSKTLGGWASSDPNYHDGQVSGLQSVDVTSMQPETTRDIVGIAFGGDSTKNSDPTWADTSHALDFPQKIGGKSVPGATPFYGSSSTSSLRGFTSSPTTGVPGSIGATGSGSSGGFPQIQSTKFVLPTNREGYVASNQPAGQKNIPYVDRFNNASNGTLINGVANGQPQFYADGRNASGQLLSRSDIDALVAHYRLRGADGIHLLDGGVLGYTQAQFEEDAKTGNFPPQVIAAMQRQLEHTATAPNESYAAIHDNPFLPVAEQPLSTFSIDVDTGSYSNIRRFLNDGQFPPPDAVRIEEMLNYFPYHYDVPKPDSKEPFATTIEIAGCPWNSAHRLARVAIKGREIAHDKRPVSNLVFLIDVSGSMNEPAKLPLVKEGLKLMVNELTENDRISIVVYAGNAGLVLPSTTADPKNRQAILNAIDNLSAGGSTNGGEGIELAYKIATDNFIKGGTNRVLLATDGDWNVGITDQSSLTQLIQDKAKSGVFLSVLGYGFGNLKDATMEKLADKGNGHYAYIDNLKESKKVLVEEMSSTLVTIAKDVKIQVEFNPSKVESYRLIGYEKRLLRKEDFNNDKVDAGEIGAGHCVTALYEITPFSRDPKGSTPATQPQSEEVDSLKYQKHEVLQSEDLMTLKLRYKQPEGDKSAKLEFPAVDKGLSYAKASEDFKFAAAVAQFGMILRSSPYKGTASLDGVLELADEGKGKDEKGYRGEFLEMVKKAKSLMK